MGENMAQTRLCISLKKDQIQQIKDLANEECRSYSHQILHMMKVYSKNKRD